MHIMEFTCTFYRPPTKLIGGFLEDGLETGAANNSDTYKMLRRESKLSKCLLFITNFTNMFVFVSIEKVQVLLA